MRTTQGLVNRYIAGQVPDDKNALIRFLRDELTRIEVAMSAMADLQLDVTTVAPPKPRAGMIRYADGTSWNPGGTGAGIYAYISGAWVKL